MGVVRDSDWMLLQVIEVLEGVSQGLQLLRVLLQLQHIPSGPHATDFLKLLFSVRDEIEESVR